jgi:DNA-directed RNA polymerase specialized sigma24 family protein
LTERRREGWSVRRIAGHLHVDDKRVRAALRDVGLPAALPPVSSTSPRLRDVEWMREQLRARTMADIARELGCPEGTVRDAARRAGRTPGPRPRRRPAILDDAEWLRAALVDRSAADVARELGCSSTTVLRAARGHGVASPMQGHRPRFPELHDPAWLAANINVGTAADLAGVLGCSVASVKAARRRLVVLQRVCGD